METTVDTMTGTGQHRLMGALTIAGGLCYVIGGVILTTTGGGSNQIANALGVLWALGAICGLIGIGLLGAVGRGVLGRVALAIATLAYVLVALDAILIVAGVFDEEASPLFAISRLGTLVGMVLVGIAAVVARRWPGWRRFSPFAVPLALPVVIAFGVATGIEVFVPVFIGLAWIVIGYAVWSTQTH